MTTPKNSGQKSGRTRTGQFATGNKISPGRPRGRSQVALLREQLAVDLEAVIATVRRQAAAGDMQAVRLLLDRVLPALRPIELPVELAMPVAGTLAAQARAVVQAAADGSLAPGQAAQIVGALAGVARIVEVDELVARIDALEAASAGGKGNA